MNKKETTYYVYIYYRLDINEPFYVGKGKGDRWKKMNRENNHFNNIANKYPIAVVVEKDTLTEEQAFYWEEKIINELVFDYGFSIDIPNNRSNNEEMFHLVNCTWGGEGCSGGNWTLNKTREEIKKITDKMVETRKEKGIGIGKNNPMYGKCYRDFMTEEQLKEHDNKVSKANKGKNLWCYLSEKEKEEVKKKISKKNSGKNNPMYGKRHSEEVRKKMGKKGIKNPRSNPIICLTTKRMFECVKYGAVFYNIKGESEISNCCRGKREFCGKLKDGTKLIWRYLNYKHNKKYRIKNKKIIRIGCDTNDK